MVVGPVVNLFANPDRGTRMALLDGLPEFADKLDKNTVANKVWPNLVRLFYDLTLAKCGLTLYSHVANWIR
jgi:SCY1-like protein 1